MNIDEALAEADRLGYPVLTALASEVRRLRAAEQRSAKS